MDNSELELFRDNVRRFFAENVEPNYEHWEKAGRVPPEFYLQMGEQGLLCVDLPEAYGGIGAPFEFSVAILEECARMGFMSLASNLSVHSDIAAPYILHLGSEEQKRKYLPRMARGECIGAIGMTEPGAGSDLQGIKTSALPDGEEHFLINGSKTFITNGQNAGVVVLATKTDPKLGARGTTLFTVESSLKGYSRGRNLDKVGQYAADTSELFFDNVRVHRSEILGRSGGGFGHLVDELPRERLVLGGGPCAGGDGEDDRIRHAAQGLRRGGGLVPEHALRAGQDQDRDRGAPRLRREVRAPLRGEEAGRADRGDGQARHLRDGGPRHRRLPAAVRRLWLHDRVPDLPLLGRRAHPAHLRRHLGDHEGGHRPQPGGSRLIR
jgi:alkylation response protein AidB-like acyl-CoA dehydrogenase